ncbi:MAG TPA: hypothetical protein VFY83_03770 [Anaerolineales bacterium]|jgi:hypothetical protein|nr:hypothetical protein [Anaerolineales bacterium]
MNNFFYESIAKEKARKLMREGMQSQEFQRSGAPKLDPMRGLPKLILGLLGTLGLLGLLIR